MTMTKVLIFSVYKLFHFNGNFHIYDECFKCKKFISIKEKPNSKSLYKSLYSYKWYTLHKMNLKIESKSHN